MKPFAELLDRLTYMPSRNGKLKLITEYLAATPDPDRGYATAALTGGLDFPAVKRSVVSELVASRVDPVLFRMSRDFVGDTAETAALIWQDGSGPKTAPKLSEVVEGLGKATRAESLPLLTAWMDTLGPAGRWALLKLVTGGLRVGVSARLAKQAIGQFGGRDVGEIEELWHGLDVPYTDLFAWLEGRAGRPEIDDRLMFRPLMLANPIEEPDLARISPETHFAEWKWDGIRVQVAASKGETRLFSRTGDEITNAFPDIADRLKFDAVLDGELLVVRDGEVAAFNDLQQRLNRKKVSARMLRDYPAHIRFYDILLRDGVDLRSLSLEERRRQLEDWFADTRPAAADLSELVPFADLNGLQDLHASARDSNIEGLMLKARDSVYEAGRPRGPWFKWKRAPLTADAVLMYAQRGSGKRSSFYSDYTFGVWRDGPDGETELVPVGKAYFGFTDEELAQLDRWVRGHTVNRFGPVREVEPGLVLEVAFDDIHPSSRHKSGLAMRFPRVHRIRWDKPVEEADRLDTLVALVSHAPGTP